MGSLNRIRRETRGDVEGILAGLKASRAQLQARLREVEAEIALAEEWLGNLHIPRPAKPLPLQEGMALVLREEGDPGMRPQRLAELINERRLYKRRDGRPVDANQIQARVSNYGHMFVRRDGLIYLREEYLREE